MCHACNKLERQRIRKQEEGPTSQTEFRPQMRSGDQPAYLSLTGPPNIITSRSWCQFVIIFPEICLLEVSTRVRRTDQRTEGPTDRRKEGHTLLKRCDRTAKEHENRQENSEGWERRDENEGEKWKGNLGKKSGGKTAQLKKKDKRKEKKKR